MSYEYLRTLHRLEHFSDVIAVGFFLCVRSSRIFTERKRCTGVVGWFGAETGQCQSVSVRVRVCVSVCVHPCLSMSWSLSWCQFQRGVDQSVRRSNNQFVSRPVCGHASASRHFEHGVLPRRVRRFLCVGIHEEGIIRG